MSAQEDQDKCITNLALLRKDVKPKVKESTLVRDFEVPVAIREVNYLLDLLEYNLSGQQLVPQDQTLVTIITDLRGGQPLPPALDLECERLLAQIERIKHNLNVLKNRLQVIWTNTEHRNLEAAYNFLDTAFNNVVRATTDQAIKANYNKKVFETLRDRLLREVKDFDEAKSALNELRQEQATLAERINEVKKAVSQVSYSSREAPPELVAALRDIVDVAAFLDAANKSLRRSRGFGDPAFNTAFSHLVDFITQFVSIIQVFQTVVIPPECPDIQEFFNQRIIPFWQGDPNAQPNPIPAFSDLEQPGLLNAANVRVFPDVGTYRRHFQRSKSFFERIVLPEAQRLIKLYSTS
ncbi:hypothetical protein KY329_03065 [Candidatus Woesearchaeota archaeon]|nr:hypothetical protein [Candidatus Woesearchaeota archaeon]